jgi:acetyl-CoA carboxylase carboxyltransferase component
VDALEAVGSLYAKQVAASGVIPQITAVFGTCGGGMAVVPALSDFTFAETDKAHLFVNSPNAIPGNNQGKCDTSSAVFQSEEAGTVDGIGTEQEIFAQIRELVTLLPSNNAQAGVIDDCTDDLNRACASLDTMKGDMRYVLSEISDGHVFVETKAAYAREMVTGFIKLNGMTIGAVANATERYVDGEKAEDYEAVLSSRGCNKAADFIAFCDAFEIPIVSFTNTTGFKATMCSEKNLAKALARLTYAFANASVPKVNLIAEHSYGSAYAVMNSKSLGADITYAWPDAKVGMMDAKLAAMIMYADASADELLAHAKEYDALQGDVKTAARRGYVDRIVDYADTRKYLVAAFEMLFTKNVEQPYKKHGAK